MNFNVWNIKEMLSMPTAMGPNKCSMRSSTASDYSSLSDSQLLFGSQFCPENMQSAAALLELGSQPGQQNSQDSEPSIFTKYQTKPQLFDEETREKGLLNLSTGRVKSVLENFEVNKNKIKDKYDREVLSAFISSTKDRLQGLQARLDKFEEMSDSRYKSILVHLETLSKKMEDALQSHRDSVLKALRDRSQMEQALLEMERRLAAKDAEISDVKSSVQLLKEGLESLPAQLNDQHLKLCKELDFVKLPNASAEQHTPVPSARLPPHVTDNSSQTSPGPCQLRVLDEEHPCQPCCRGSRVCSCSGWSHFHCMTVGEQHRHSPGRNQITEDGTSKGAASGGKAIATEACDRANTSLQKMKYGLETQSCATHPCICWADSNFLGGSQKKHCPVPLEAPLPTPRRKAFRRGTGGFEALTPSQQQQPQGCHQSVWKAPPGQKDSNESTDHKVQKAAVGNKTKQSPGRIPWNKAVGRKKACPAKRKGELSRCADSGLKQRKANGIIELESSRKNCFPRYLVDLNSESSDPVFAARHQQILSSAQPGLTENFPPVPCSDKSLQQLASRRKKSLEIKRRVNVSTVKTYILDSSPEGNILSLCSTTGVEQMSCFNLQSPSSSKKPHPANLLAQKNPTCCPLLFDSDSSD
ncbi:PREDICTED: coiled-coil domain-containing protein 36 [Lepidothrix coronata]|uniref:Coiled-coil domain-containing protein 36 n=1 Tax=Lepidothrix coronata TaxID=321398 RepID=A0A6J0HRF4_9PASS|nr:PREDICTED: coiled-coil domain-containing protein 36 [Lepidothrix coronata]XP_017676161.1 PREDICTED: coiled-coil domain-containing protein 36 [Lepidothrix coronata]XP_017676162.1 PREDICTED: coiled-coil domain-containing protein 36 [Lepidothrix coronata]XP_017676163.1 PREDICTED: coiled-coil domain-containing protein 36 [Lepidothrix coronata]XP_017676164.1 PREDICTED: coiled-coil domain-containing protein 36 [Lepidothrix coronata]